MRKKVVAVLSLVVFIFAAFSKNFVVAGYYDNLFEQQPPATALLEIENFCTDYNDRIDLFAENFTDFKDELTLGSLAALLAKYGAKGHSMWYDCWEAVMFSHAKELAQIINDLYFLKNYLERNYKEILPFEEYSLATIEDYPFSSIPSLEEIFDNLPFYIGTGTPPNEYIIGLWNAVNFLLEKSNPFNIYGYDLFGQLSSFGKNSHGDTYPESFEKIRGHFYEALTKFFETVLVTTNFPSEFDNVD